MRGKISVGHITLILVSIAIIFMAYSIYQNQTELDELHSLIEKETEKDNNKPLEFVTINPHQSYIDNHEKEAGMPLSRIARILIHDEGVRNTPYLDTKGKPTIGVGRSLATNGLSITELHAIVPEPNYRHILDESRVQHGRIYIDTLEQAHKIFPDPLSEHDIVLLLTDDLKNTARDAQAVFGSHWQDIDSVRQEAILDLVFNLGLPHFKSFEKFIEDVIQSNWSKAAVDLLDSEAARTDITRYQRIFGVIQSGDDRYFNLK